MSEEKIITEAEAAVEETVEAVSDTVVNPVVDAVKETVAKVADEAKAVVEAAVESAEEVKAAVEAKVTETVEAVSEMAAEVTAEAETVTEAVTETMAETVTESAADVVAEAESVVEAAADAVAGESAGESSDDGADESAGESADSKEKRVVRTLSVGQMITGKVKRTTEFGAFVDIGVGRDGLVHISELAVGRVQKVTDVLKEGESVDVWIKKLDRNRNRISLTMISPETVTIKDLNEGDVVEGTVTRIVPYGAFIDLGVGRDGLLHIREMSNGYVGKPEDVVKSGEKIEVRIIALNRKRGRIDLSLKGLRPEDEAEAAVVETEAQAQTSQTEEVIEVEEIEVLSPMELAFKKATEAQGIDVDLDMDNKNQRSDKRSRRRQARAAQDEIIARTLDAIKD